MSEIGRDHKREAYRDEILARIAKGIEKLAEEPVLEMEVAPPVCPHCGVFNPLVTVNDKEATGNLVEFAIQLECCECGKTFYGAPVQWSMHKDVDTLRNELTERAGYVRGSDRDNAAARASTGA